MAIVLAMSSAPMSAENTGGVLRPLLAWLGVGPLHADLIHLAVRKAGHIVEYGILAVLWRHAFVRRGVARPGAAAALALAISIACAVVDETRPAFVASRTGAVSAVALDSLAALAANGVAHLSWWKAIDVATGVLLWIAVAGGIGALALDLAVGAGGGVLWLTVPAAALLLVYRWRRSPWRS
jgi:VanZ family protein